MSSEEHFESGPAFVAGAAPELLPSLTSPVCALIARTNVDAQLKAILLNEAGIRAVAVDDISLVGYFALGAIDNLHRPQVFVDQSQLDAAHKLLADHTCVPSRGESEVFCFHCGADLSASSSVCPECHGRLEAEAVPGEGDDSDRMILRGRTLFQKIEKLGTVAMLLYLLPALLVGIYAVYLLISTPFKW